VRSGCGPGQYAGGMPQGLYRSAGLRGMGGGPPGQGRGACARAAPVGTGRLPLPAPRAVARGRRRRMTGTRRKPRGLALQCARGSGIQMGIMRLRVVFGLVLLALACAAPAQQLPRPAEFYFDEDERIARPLVAVEGDD